MKYILGLVTALLLLSGCSSSSDTSNDFAVTAMTSKHLTMADFSHQLANQLFDSARGVQAGQRVAVTSPVWLASGMKESSLVGLQLQQELAAELHAMSLDVVEYKLTDGIRVTPLGDFALSTDYLELRELQAADYILVGTLVERDNSLVVSLRMLEFSTQIVKATAQIAIPHWVTEDLMHINTFQLVNPGIQ